MDGRARLTRLAEARRARGGRQQGLVLGVLTAWADLRGSMRRLLASGPREGTLLGFAVLSGLVWFLGRIGGLWLSPEAAISSEAALIGRAQGEFVSAVFFRTLMLYAVAALAGLAARALGGRGTWRESRAATFWAALVAAPVMLVASIVAGALEAFPGPAAALVRTLGGLAFAWAFAACLAEAHGFRSAARVLAVVVALGLLVLIAGYILA